MRMLRYYRRLSEQALILWTIGSIFFSEVNSPSQVVDNLLPAKVAVGKILRSKHRPLEVGQKLHFDLV